MKFRTEWVFVLAVVALLATAMRKDDSIHQPPTFPVEASSQIASALLERSLELSYPKVPEITVEGAHLGMTIPEFRKTWPDVTSHKLGKTDLFRKDGAGLSTRNGVAHQQRLVHLSGSSARLGDLEIEEGFSQNKILKLLGEPDNKNYGSCGMSVAVDWNYQVNGVIFTVSFLNEQHVDRKNTPPAALLEYLGVLELSVSYKERTRLL